MAEEPELDRPASKLLTFLIADVRGYTRFTAERGDEAAARLARRFAELAEESAGKHGGKVLELRGDEALLVFPSARNALRAALALQAAFRQARASDPSLPLGVGMGMDAGEVIPVRGGYRGGALNLAARLCSIAGEGEVLCSETVTGLARKMEGLTYVDRGEVGLKGLSQPVPVVQVLPEGEEPPDPPRFAVAPAPPTNLPVSATPFIGRERELGKVSRMLRSEGARLVTLTGPGGTGKTRLALQLGEGLLSSYADGVFLAALASLTDPALVPSAIAVALGLKEETDQPLADVLTGYLRPKQLLLILDNFEHLLPAASLLADLLARCPRLSALVTSRAVLHLAAEHEYPVLPLAVPEPRGRQDLETLARYDAVTLFVERARAAKPAFTLTEDNARAVAEICVRLEGLPLAIELAAARTRLFPPHALLQRLSRRLALLTGGPRDAPLRQQTLRDAIEWSYSLLEAEEQRLFALLSVFAGGFTFGAAEAVCPSDAELDLLDGLTSLLEKSLLRQVEGAEIRDEEPRFLMLETLRELAAEKLNASGEEQQTRGAHAEFFITLAEGGQRHFWGPGQGAWLAQLDRELDNIRAALDWSLRAGDPAVGLRLAMAITMMWSETGRLSEGRRWVEAFLARGIGAGTAIYAGALDHAGMLARGQADYEHAELRLGQALNLYRQLGDLQGTAMALAHLGGLACLRQELELAGPLLEDCITLHEQLEDKRYLSSALTNLGLVRMMQGSYAEARVMLDRAIALRREQADEGAIGQTLVALGRLEQMGGDAARAAAVYREALAHLQAAGNVPLLVDAIEGIAALLWDVEDDRAARLWGAATSIRESIGLPAAAPDGADRDRETWRRAWDEGRAMKIEDAITYAMEGSSRF